MGGGAEADDGFASIEIGCEVGDLIVRKLAESGADDHQIRFVQRVRSGDVFLEIRVDVAAVRVDGEEHGAVESVFLAEDLREHRARFLAAVFFVAGNENDILAIRGSSFGRETQPLGSVHGCAAEDESGK